MYSIWFLPQSWSLGFRTGIMKTLDNRAPCLSDRFMLGGPTCVRMFRMNTLGPKQKRTYDMCISFSDESLGGDAYWAAGASLLAPIPTRSHWPLRLHTFLNTGQLMQMQPRMYRYWLTIRSTIGTAHIFGAHATFCFCRCGCAIPTRTCALRVELRTSFAGARGRRGEERYPIRYRTRLFVVCIERIAPQERPMRVESLSRAKKIPPSCARRAYNVGRHGDILLRGGSRKAAVEVPYAIETKTSRGRVSSSSTSSIA